MPECRLGNAAQGGVRSATFGMSARPPAPGSSWDPWRADGSMMWCIWSWLCPPVADVRMVESLS